MAKLCCKWPALNHCMTNMLDVPIIPSITPNVLKMLIQGPVAPVSRMGTPCVVYRHPTSFWCPYLAFSPSNWSMRQLRHVANSKTTFWQLRHLRLSFAFWLILGWSKWMPKAGWTNPLRAPTHTYTHAHMHARTHELAHELTHEHTRTQFSGKYSKKCILALLMLDIGPGYA